MEFKKYIYKYISITVSALLLIAVYFIIKYTQVGVDCFKYAFYYCDALFISGGVLFCLGMFALINLWGGFDIFKYLVSKEKNQYHLTLRDYSEKKSVELKKVSKGIIPWFLISITLIIVAVILLFFV